MISSEHVEHLRRYWSLARDFFDRGHSGLAAFFAVTLIEEVGKLPMLALENARGFKKHQKKYESAVEATLFVNSRVTRVYGPCESEFAEWYRTGALFRIRNQGLYAEFEDGQVRLPDESVSSRNALLIVCIAGEVLAEIQGGFTGTGPDEHREVLHELDTFFEKHRDLLRDCLPIGEDQ